MTMHSFST